MSAGCHREPVMLIDRSVAKVVLVEWDTWLQASQRSARSESSQDLGVHPRIALRTRSLAQRVTPSWPSTNIRFRMRIQLAKAIGHGLVGSTLLSATP